MCALIEAFRTTAAPRDRRGIAFWTVKNAPFRFVAIVSSKNASVTSSIGTNFPMPALTNRASIRPKRSLIRSIAAPISETREKSALIASRSGPSSFWAAFSVASLRPVIATLAPSRANALAVASPMPLFPPVTTAILFLNLSLILSSFESSTPGRRLPVLQAVCQGGRKRGPVSEHAERASVGAKRRGNRAGRRRCLKSHTCAIAVSAPDSSLRLDEALQTAQGVVPEERDPFEVPARVGQAHRLDLPDALAPAPCAPDQPRPGENVQVLGDRLAGHGDLRAQTRDRFGAARGQAHEQPETCLVPEGREQGSGVANLGGLHGASPRHGAECSPSGSPTPRSSFGTPRRGGRPGDDRSRTRPP